MFTVYKNGIVLVMSIFVLKKKINIQDLPEDVFIEILDFMLGVDIKHIGTSNKNIYDSMESKRCMKHIIKRLFLENLKLVKIVNNNRWSFKSISLYQSRASD